MKLLYTLFYILYLKGVRYTLFYILYLEDIRV